MRQPRLKYLKPSEVMSTPPAMPIVTRPTSPIQRFSNAYLRKKAVAKRINETAAQPTQRRPIIDSMSLAVRVAAGGVAAGGVVVTGVGTDDGTKTGGVTGCGACSVSGGGPVIGGGVTTPLARR